jgi:hypothetical protein
MSLSLSLCSLALVKSTHARLSSGVSLCVDVLNEIIAYARAGQEHKKAMLPTLANIRRGLFWCECGYCSVVVLRWHGLWHRTNLQACETFLCRDCWANSWTFTDPASKLFRVYLRV